jgi:hypothetical protein
MSLFNSLSGMVVRRAARHTGPHRGPGHTDPAPYLFLERLEERLCPSTTACWWFEEHSPGVPATGPNTVLDYSGHELHGTPRNGPVYRGSVGDDTIPLAGESNTLSLDFNGVNQRVFIPDDSRFRLTHSLTLEAYIKVRSSRPPDIFTEQIVFRGDDRTEQDPYYMWLDGDRVTFLINSQTQRSPSSSR